MGDLGEGETGGRGDGGTINLLGFKDFWTQNKSIPLPVSQSPSLPVSQSPSPPVPQSPRLQILNGLFG